MKWTTKAAAAIIISNHLLVDHACAAEVALSGTGPCVSCVDGPCASEVIVTAAGIPSTVPGHQKNRDHVVQHTITMLMIIVIVWYR